MATSAIPFSLPPAPCTTASQRGRSVAGHDSARTAKIHSLCTGLLSYQPFIDMLRNAGATHPIKGIYTWLDARGNTVLAVQTTAQNFSFILDDTINDGNIIKAADVLLDPSQPANHSPDFTTPLPPQPAQAPPAKTHLKRNLIAGAVLIGAGILGRAQLGTFFLKAAKVTGFLKAAKATGATTILEKTLKQAANVTTKISDFLTPRWEMCRLALETTISSAPIFLYGALASAGLSALAQKKIAGKVSPKTTFVHGITGGLGVVFSQNTISAAVTALKEKGTAALLSGQELTGLALKTAISATPALLLGGIAFAALVAIAQKKAGRNINAKATLISGVVGGLGTAYYQEKILSTPTLLFTLINDTGTVAVQPIQMVAGAIGTAGVVGLAAAGIIALIGSGAAGAKAKTVLGATVNLLKQGCIATGQIARKWLSNTANQNNQANSKQPRRQNNRNKAKSKRLHRAP